MRDLEKKYRKFRRPEKPEYCSVCGGKRFSPKGEMWCCVDCGKWDGDQRENVYRRPPEPNPLR